MKKIALVLKTDTDEGVVCAKKTIKFLLDYGCDVYTDVRNKEYVDEFDGIFYKDEQRVFDEVECVIVFGGDGTIMRVAHRTHLPILGINFGRIGYLAELESDELDLLEDLVNDNFSLEYRMMLRCIVSRNERLLYETSNILNEIVLSRGSDTIMPEIELFCNGEEVGKYFSDGLICATPTGSTAYSLSAGGSIVDTRLNCFCVTPICPQSFYAKPLIFDGKSVLVFKKGKRGHGKIELMCDGQRIREIIEDDEVMIARGQKETKLIKIKKNNFYSVMRSKMTEI
ncbi:MAG: NAD(+)/NADH kinase [Clostridia bacterium]|nr:NAD(+)/NADH kinase [Clostridia bacterium]